MVGGLCCDKDQTVVEYSYGKFACGEQKPEVDHSYVVQKNEDAPFGPTDEPEACDTFKKGHRYIDVNYQFNLLMNEDILYFCCPYSMEVIPYKHQKGSQMGFAMPGMNPSVCCPYGSSIYKTPQSSMSESFTIKCCTPGNKVIGYGKDGFSLCCESSDTKVIKDKDGKWVCSK